MFLWTCGQASQFQVEILCLRGYKVPSPNIVNIDVYEFGELYWAMCHRCGCGARAAHTGWHADTRRQRSNGLQIQIMPRPAAGCRLETAQCATSPSCQSRGGGGGKKLRQRKNTIFFSESCAKECCCIKIKTICLLSTSVDTHANCLFKFRRHAK